MKLKFFLKSLKSFFCLNTISTRNIFYNNRALKFKYFLLIFYLFIIVYNFSFFLLLYTKLYLNNNNNTEILINDFIFFKYNKRINSYNLL